MDGPIYDEFYVQIYDVLMLSDDRSSHIWNAFLKAVQPYSGAAFLDVGSGTGSMVKMISDSGYSCVGADSSEAMIQYSSELYPTLPFVHKSVMDAMLFERGVFFGVFCLGMTVYEWTDADKLQFFKNAYFWMRPGGYLVLHLVDVDRFSSVVPAGVSMMVVDGDLGNVLDSELNFGGFSYKNGFDSAGCGCVRRESFTDLATGYVRENELNMYLDKEPRILQLAERAGFLMAGKWNLGGSVYRDQHQYLYLLERTL
jgi:SAM-dependent methyltransferase